MIYSHFICYVGFKEESLTSWDI